MQDSIIHQDIIVAPIFYTQQRSRPAISKLCTRKHQKIAQDCVVVILYWYILVWIIVRVVNLYVCPYLFMAGNCNYLKFAVL